MEIKNNKSKVNNNTNNNKRNKVNIGIEILRVILCFWVLTFHLYKNKNRKYCKILNTYYHVPTFMIISFYLTNKLFSIPNIIKIKQRIIRLLFPYLTYEKGFRAVSPKKPHTATIYTMNVREEGFNQSHLDTIEWYISHVFSKPERICAFNTCQVNDYKKYRMDVFDEGDKLNYKAKNWEKDLDKAFIAGKNMAEKI